MKEEIKGGCFSCKHFESKIINPVNNDIMGGWMPSNGNLLFGVRRCNKGENLMCFNWWKNNGDKKAHEEIENLFCFEPHESTVKLKEMNDLAMEILNKIKTLE